MPRYIALLLLLLSACAPRPEDGDRIAAEAITAHQQALEAGRELQPRIEELIQRRNGIEVQGRALTDAELQFVDRANNLISRFEVWRESRPALPDQPRTTHLKEQQDYLNAIQAIGREVTALLSSLE